MTGTARHNVRALEAALAASEARVSAAEAQIASLQLMIVKLRRALYGQRSERKERLLDQLELALDDLTADAGEDDLAAEKAAAKTTEVKGFVRRKPSRKPFPEHLPRERVVVPGPASCTCCGSERLSKIGEDVTETLEVIPRQWKVIQTVREKFSCRDCEKISQPPAPFHATPRGWAGPNLLATILFEKYGAHQPLNRQSERYAREGVALSTSTLADQVGACAVALKPLHDLIVAHVLAAERLHGDDTPVPVLAKGKAATGRAWVYVRDDAPFAGPDETLETGPRDGAARRQAQIVVDDLDPGETVPARHTDEIVLAALALEIVPHLLGCGLTDVDHGLARQHRPRQRIRGAHRHPPSPRNLPLPEAARPARPRPRRVAPGSGHAAPVCPAAC